MCTSKAEGGMRCSAHARTALQKAIADYADQRGSGSVAERQAMLDNIVRKRFEYATTPEGKAEAERQIAEQSARANVEAETLQKSGKGISAFASGPENRTLQAMETAQRLADKFRAEQETARERYHEVSAGDVGPMTAKALAEEQSRPPENVSVKDFNGTTHRSTIIGAVAIDEPFTVTDASYETAAWSKTHEVQPGVYPVHLTSDAGSRDLTWRYDTKVTDQNMSPLLGGVPQGPGPKDDIGNDSHLNQRKYAFSASSAYTPGLQFGGGSLVLRKGVAVDHHMPVRDGHVSAVLTRFKVTDVVDREPV